MAGCHQQPHVHRSCHSKALDADSRLRRGAARVELILSIMATGLRMPESQAEALASRLEGWTGLQGVVSSHLPNKLPEQVSIFSGMPVQSSAIYSCCMPYRCAFW